MMQIHGNVFSVSVAFFTFAGMPAIADAPKDTAVPRQLQPADLKLTSVVAYSAGLGFVSYTGEMKDDGVFRIAIRERELDDLLKSVVVLSQSGTATVHLPNDMAGTKREEHRFVQADTVGEILQSLRGEPVVVKLDVSQSIEGQILAVELRSMAEGAELVDREIVTLLSDGGIVSIPLKKIATWWPTRADVRQRLERELVSVATDQWKADPGAMQMVEVEVRFHGLGNRDVTVGWLRSMPIWKPSYRFLDGQLQLWTTVENTSREDWNDVTLTMVDGHPIVFRSPLYRTRFAHRAIVPLPLPDERLPPEFAEIYGNSGGAPIAIPSRDELRSAARGGPAGGSMGGGMGGMGFGGGFFGGGQTIADGDPFAADPATTLGEDLPVTAAGGPQRKQATGADLHVTTQGVTVARGASRSAPSPELKIDAEIISVFAESHDPHTPLRCLQVVNRMPMRLPAGPLTVYSAGTFVGDAMLPELSPGVPRLVGFANDANIRINVTHEVAEVQPLESLRVDLGKKEFVEVVPLRRAVRYRIDSRIRQPRTLLIDHSKPQLSWSIAEGDVQPEETTASWRYRIGLKPDEERTMEVVELQRIATNYGWSDVPIESLVAWSTNAVVDEKTESEVKRVLQLRRKRTDLQERLSVARQRLGHVRSETSRIAELIQEIASVTGTELPARYVDKLSQFEDEIETLEQQAAVADAELRAIDRELQ